MTNTKTITSKNIDGIVVVKNGIGSTWNKVLDKTPIRKGREKVIKDYFDLYRKSGIIDFFAKKIRAEFDIPRLHLSDLQLIILPINEGESTEEEKSQWYESLPEEKKATFNNRINEILRQLYLPTSAFEMLLHFFLYRKTVNSYPLDNTELLYSLAYGYTIDEILGYTPSEIRAITKLAIDLLQEKREMTSTDNSLDEKQKNKELEWVDKQITLVSPRCEVLIKKLTKTTRPLRDLQNDIRIIKALKEYKKLHIDEDIFNFKTLTWVTSSREIAISLCKKKPLTPVEERRLANKFRQQVKRLLKKYPFLKEFT